MPSSLRKDHNLGSLINQVGKLLARELNTELQKYGASIGHWLIFVALWGREGMTQIELANAAKIEASTMTHTLDRMERDGFISRRRDEQNRRSVRVHLTARGRELKRVMLPAANRINDAAVKHLTATQRRELHSLLRRVHDTLEDQ